MLKDSELRKVERHVRAASDVLTLARARAMDQIEVRRWTPNLIVIYLGERYARLYKRADGKWLIQWKEDGKWRNTTRKTEEEAIIKGSEIVIG